MSDLRTPAAPSDAELVAYLDGELSPRDSVRIGQQAATDGALAERLDRLMTGARPFGASFAPLLHEAPAERLEAMLAGLLGRPPVRHPGGWPLRLQAAAAAAGIALMVGGATLDRLVVQPLWLASTRPRGEADDSWRSAVAQYLSLFTSETLAVIPDTEAARRQELASVGGKLGLDLTLARADLPDMVLKRAEMFDYDGQALGFLAYLDPRSGPVSLCIVAGAGRDTPPRTEHRRGMNVVYWSRAGHGFMVIGRGDLDRLRVLAGLVADRFGGRASEQPAEDRG